MTSVLFLAMLLALAFGAGCFGLACLLKIRESRRRVVFFAGCLLGFWGGCVGLLADQIGALFVSLQIGMEESVNNAFLQHWRTSGRETSGVDVATFRLTSRLCTAQDLASSQVRDCSLALGVNSASVCRQWVLYVPLFLPYLRPCPALRTNAEILNNVMAREVLIDAINRPCSFVPAAQDYTTKSIRKALRCDDAQSDDNVLLIVDQTGGAKTLVMHRGSARLP